MLRDLILQNRSYRSFSGDRNLPKEMLFRLVDLARLGASAGNRQPLKYFLSCEQDVNERLYPLLRLFCHPNEDAEKPAAYICMFIDTELASPASSAYVDAGIAAQNILLGAAEMGLGGCIITGFDKLRLKHELMITSSVYEPFMIIALGKPDEDIILEESGYDTECYADSAGTRHVPKRQLMDIIIGI